MIQNIQLSSGNVRPVHILYCDAYADLRADRDISNTSDLVEYMKNVLTVREKLGLTKWKLQWTIY